MIRLVLIAWKSGKWRFHTNAEHGIKLVEEACFVFGFEKGWRFRIYPQMLPIWGGQICGGKVVGFPKFIELTLQQLPGEESPTTNRLNFLQNSGLQLPTEQESENCQHNIVVNYSYDHQPFIESKIQIKVLVLNRQFRFSKYRSQRIVPVKERKTAHFYPATTKAIRITFRIRLSVDSPFSDFSL